MSLSVSLELADQAPVNPQSILARFVFCSGDPLSEYDCETGMPQVSGHALAEVWRVKGPVRRHQQGPVSLSISDDYCLAAVTVAVDFSEMHRDSKQAYELLFGAMPREAFPHIVKTWNYIPDINGGGEGDGEYYKQFCCGRAEAYANAKLGGDAIPAATAVGIEATGLLRVYILSTKHKTFALENPRQVSAYDYPREFGPTSPVFSRAVYLDTHQFFLSGTAAITEYHSRHMDNPQRQAVETIENISALIKNANSHAHTSQFDIRNGIYRIHLRRVDPDIRQFITARLQQTGVAAENLIFVKADVCRRELLVEIDGILFTANQQN